MGAGAGSVGAVASAGGAGAAAGSAGAGSRFTGASDTSRPVGEASTSRSVAWLITGMVRHPTDSHSRAMPDANSTPDSLPSSSKTHTRSPLTVTIVPTTQDRHRGSPVSAE